jgi:branched-chain amino acid transport system permease protein
MVTALSALFTWLSLRLEEDGFGVLTIAMHLIVLTIILNWQSMTRGALGIPQIPRLWLPESLEGMTAVCLVIAVLWCLFLLHIERSSFSRSLVALSEHPWHAEALGVSRSRCHFLAFFIAGMGSFLANILYPPYLYLLSPSNYDFPAMIFFVTCVLAGGPGKTVPVFFMCFVLIFLRESLRLLPIAPDLVGPLHLLLFAVILFAAVWYRRNSLFPKRRTV